MPPEIKKALIVVRTYPSPAKSGAEVSCTAAISESGEWLRLFPVPYRFLEPDKRFAKYQWIRAAVYKAAKDPRPESYKIDIDSIEILGPTLPTTRAWQERKDLLEHLRSPSLCALKRGFGVPGSPTLGFFRPKKIVKFTMEPGVPDWSERQLSMLQQGGLFEKGPRRELVKVPFSFKYKFYCDDDECKGHNLSCIDWEIGESWRKWKMEYGDEWEAKFRQKYDTEMIDKLDTHFFVGTIHMHPKEWIIVGLFYPPHPKPEHPSFDF